MEKIIYHIDVNSAFLSWEASYRINILGDSLDLREIPSVIGGNEKSRHGIVLAKSIPAKKYCIQTGEPLVSARNKCPNLVVVPPNYPMYIDASQALMALLSDYSSDLEQYSIDEAFLDMTGTSKIFGSPISAAHLIKDRVKNELGFTVNIGISNNKLLAKMASDFKKPDMVHTLFPHEIPKKMWPLPVSDLFFVGKATEKKLHAIGISTIGELAHTDKSILYSKMKSHGNIIWEFANGIDTQMSKFINHPVTKGYGNSMTIPIDVSDRQTAIQVLLSLVETIASRIRADKALISVVSVNIVYSSFEYCSKQTTLNTNTDNTNTIYDAACSLFDAQWNSSPIRQLGVHTGKVTSDCCHQYSLFDNPQDHGFDKAIDEIRAEFGEDAIMRASFISSPLEHMAGGLDRAKRTGITKY